MQTVAAVQRGQQGLVQALECGGELAHEAPAGSLAAFVADKRSLQVCCLKVAMVTAWCLLVLHHACMRVADGVPEAFAELRLADLLQMQDSRNMHA